MLTPNFGIMLWIILITWFIRGIISIFAGALHTQKHLEHDFLDVIAGIIDLIFVFIIFIYGGQK